MLAFSSLSTRPEEADEKTFRKALLRALRVGREARQQREAQPAERPGNFGEAPGSSGEAPTLSNFFRKMLPFWKNPEKIWLNLAKIQQNSDRICEILEKNQKKIQQIVTKILRLETGAKECIV